MANTPTGRIAELFRDLGRQLTPGERRVEEVLNNALGLPSAFILGTLVGFLVAEIGAEKTDETMLLLIATIERQRIAATEAGEMPHADGGGI